MGTTGEQAIEGAERRRPWPIAEVLVSLRVQPTAPKRGRAETPQVSVTRGADVVNVQHSKPMAATAEADSWCASLEWGGPCARTQGEQCTMCVWEQKSFSVSTNIRASWSETSKGGQGVTCQGRRRSEAGGRILCASASGPPFCCLWCPRNDVAHETGECFTSLPCPRCMSQSKDEEQCAMVKVEE